MCWLHLRRKKQEVQDELITQDHFKVWFEWETWLHSVLSACMWYPRLCRAHSFEVCGLDKNGPIGSCIRMLSYREWSYWFTLGRINHKHERDLELLYLCCINIQNLKCIKVCSFKNTIIGKNNMHL